MKFYIKSEFIYNGVLRPVGSIVEVPPAKISEFKKIGVLGFPVKETEIETAVLKPAKETQKLKKQTKKAKR